MAIPDIQTLMLPVLKLGANSEIFLREAYDRLATEFKLTEAEREEMVPSGTDKTFPNRVRWSIAQLVQAGLVDRPKRGQYVATDLGKRVLRSKPERIDVALLSQFESYNAFRARHKGAKKEEPEPESETIVRAEAEGVAEAPEERIGEANNELLADLKSELLSRLARITPRAFEKVVIALLSKMGFGRGRHLGGPGDGGVDGVIMQDALGLNNIYMQAKRYDPSHALGSDEIDQFSGAIDRRGATLGVMVTTSRFTAAARKAADGARNKRLVLIDGDQLADLMVEHDVAVRTVQTIHVKKIDDEYLEEIED